MILAVVAGSTGSAGAAFQTALPQVLPLPPMAPARTSAPLAPPINPGYAAAPADGLSPILSTSVPVYQFPQPPNASYPPPQLPGPIDQQKLQAYRNDLHAQQWQLQSQGVSLGSTLLGRQILQQLNAPDTQ
jgi:hypothetical protein